jgi:hypothetical protein
MAWTPVCSESSHVAMLSQSCVRFKVDTGAAVRRASGIDSKWKEKHIFRTVADNIFLSPPLPLRTMHG